MSGSDMILTALLAMMALLYASVGHAGSSGYQAAMGIMGVSAAMMKPTALCLNVVVSLIATVQFARQGCVDYRRWFWLACGSIPAAVLGGFLTLPMGWYYLLVALVLWLAAVRFWFVGLPGAKPQEPGAWSQEPGVKEQLKSALLILMGVGLGFLSGLTGTGGGIFLTPMLVLCGWSTPRQAAGLSAAFILANSPAGLLGWWQKTKGAVVLPELLPWWLVIVAIMGWLGAWYGSRYGSPIILRRLLSLVLVIAGAKMVIQVFT